MAAVEYGYPSPQAALCTVCGKFSWLCPHPWELREAGAAWEAFNRGMPWPPTRVVEERKREAARAATAVAIVVPLTPDDADAPWEMPF